MKAKKKAGKAVKERTLIIDRKVWLRGESDSALLRGKDGKRCCVGVYLKALRVKDPYMLEVGRADMVRCGLPGEAKWLDSANDFQAIAWDLYGINDSPSVLPRKREASVRRLFAKATPVPVKVKFVGRSK